MDQKANTYKLCINPSILGWFISIKVFISHKSCEAAITSILQTKTLSIKALDLLLLLVLFHINGRYCVRHANTPTDSIPLQCDDVSLCSLFDREEPTFSHSAMSNSLQPMNYNTPGFPVLHYFPEFAQAHVH